MRRLGNTLGNLIFILALVVGFCVLLSMCTNSEFTKDWDTKQAIYYKYKDERILFKICHDGTKIWSWDNKYWISGAKWPDQEVRAGVC